MTRTRLSRLVALAAAGAIAGLLGQLGLGALGLSKLIPAPSLAVTLVLVAAVVVALAVPVRRATRGPVRRRVDPFYATRVVVLAKASAVAGALLAGAGAGMLVELLVRPVSTPDAVWRTGAMLAAAGVMLVAGLVAESMCTVPPGDDEGDPPGGEAA